MLFPVKEVVAEGTVEVRTSNQQMMYSFSEQKGENGAGFGRLEPRIQRQINYLRRKNQSTRQLSLVWKTAGWLGCSLVVSKLVYMHKSDRELMGGQSVDFRFGGDVKDGEGSVRGGGIKFRAFLKLS